MSAVDLDFSSIKAVGAIKRNVSCSTVKFRRYVRCNITLASQTLGGGAESGLIPIHDLWHLYGLKASANRV